MTEKEQLFNEDTFRIDNKHLDVEWENQAQCAFEIGRYAAEARFAYDDARRLLDLAEAEANLAVRQNPTAYGLTMPKPTEAAITSTVTALPEIQQKIDAVNKARRDFELINQAVTAIEHKKKALESLTQLKQMNYYSAK